jgi:hypothetical protein
MAGIKYKYKPSEFAEALDEALQPMAIAAHAAVTETGRIAVRDGNAHIRGAGFTSAKWQGLYSKVEPKQPAINVTATIRHRFGPIAIFEYGGVIRGDPLLWLPIEKNLPSVTAGERWTPRRFASRFGKLRSARRGLRPLLFGMVGGKSVPVFHGVESVSISKRLDVTGVIQKAADQLQALYFKHLKV